MINEDSNQKLYDLFIRNGLAVGFTDDQIDFLWEYVNRVAQLKAVGGGMF